MGEQEVAGTIIRIKTHINRCVNSTDNTLSEELIKYCTLKTEYNKDKIRMIQKRNIERNIRD